MKNETKTLKEKLDMYYQLQKEIYEYFGYREEWHVYPLNDDTEYYWYLGDYEVHFSEVKENLEKIVANGLSWEGEGIDSSDYYTNLLIGGDKGLAGKGADFTLLRVDTQADGNDFLMVLSNDKEVTNE